MNIVHQKAQDLAAKLSINEMALSDIDSQLKTLQAKKKKMQGELDAFKDELREGMAESGILRIENADHGILFRLDAPSKRVDIEDESAIPEKFYRVKKELDRTAIKKALEVGDDVSGAKLVEGKHRLTIKA